MRPTPFFVTGTDTEVGKTFIAAALLDAARSRGLSCAALKPVAAGCQWIDGEFVNDDARILMQASGAGLDYPTVNPIALEPAIAPHIAAMDAGVELSATALARHCRDVLDEGFDFAVVEGAGGWLAPLNADETLADVCTGIGARPVLVVGLKLGCLNHAMLTAGAITRAGADLAGWIGNSPGTEMPRHDENVATLRARLDAPCLGVVPHLGACAEPSQATPYLDIQALLE